MIELARHQNPCDTICFHTEISPADLILYADENLIAQVVINLLKNAIQAIGSQPDGRIDFGLIAMIWKKYGSRSKTTVLKSRRK